MIKTYVSYVRNVNHALHALRDSWENYGMWRTVHPRGMLTREVCGTVITEYERPCERVLFNPARDANPFFHFFESLWILAGRRDVGFLSQFNSTIKNYSDNGDTFHAAYGYRLRRHFRTGDGEEIDQLVRVIEMLREEPDTRRAVMMIWDPREDLATHSRDIPCNDTVMFKLRDKVLDMTVCNRSNDAIWGAYGANAVQFSVLQEFVAHAVNADVGCYRQVSDSFHVYPDQSAWINYMADTQSDSLVDPYTEEVRVRPYRLVSGFYRDWLVQNDMFLNGELDKAYQNPMRYGRVDSFFTEVATPMLTAWRIYKGDHVEKNLRISAAATTLAVSCMAEDWRRAGIEWLERRREA